MKRRDWQDEELSDVKNMQEYTFLPGQYTSFDLSLFYPCGFVP